MRALPIAAGVSIGLHSPCPEWCGHLIVAHPAGECKIHNSQGWSDVPGDPGRVPGCSLSPGSGPVAARFLRVGRLWPQYGLCAETGPPGAGACAHRAPEIVRIGPNRSCLADHRANMGNFRRGEPCVRPVRAYSQGRANTRFAPTRRFRTGYGHSEQRWGLLGTLVDCSRSSATFYGD